MPGGQIPVVVEGDGGLLRSNAQPDGIGDIHVLCQLREDAALGGGVPEDLQSGVGGKADPVAEGHVHDTLGHAVLRRPGGLYLALPGQLVEGVPRGLILRAAHKHIHRVARLLEFGGEHVRCLHRGDGKGDEGGGDVQVQEGAGHGVLAADGRRTAVGQLGVQRPQQGGEGFAPALRVVPQLLEELLEGEVGLFVVRPRRRELGQGEGDAGPGPGEGVGGQQLRVAAPGHHAGLVRLLPRHGGQQRRHGLGGGGLCLAAEGHEHRARADGAVEPLH